MLGFCAWLFALPRLKVFGDFILPQNHAPVADYPERQNPQPGVTYFCFLFLPSSFGPSHGVGGGLGVTWGAAELTCLSGLCLGCTQE